VGDDEIRSMLTGMVDQRRREIQRCESCARLDVAEQEAEEIGIIQQFLPPRMSEAEIGAAVEVARRSAGGPLFFTLHIKQLF
jgi:uncharacterized protein YqeY